LAYCLANQGANKSDIVNMFEFGGNRAGYAAIIPIGLVCVRIAYGRAMSVGQTVEFVSGQFLHLCAVIERAVILSNHGVLSNPLPVAAAQTVAISPAATTLRDSERAVILQTLEAAGWAVGGPNGAAAKLGLKRTTLIYKMQKLAISRPGLQSSLDLTGSAPQEPTSLPQSQ
jgi:hypothetical protein